MLINRSFKAANRQSDYPGPANRRETVDETPHPTIFEVGLALLLSFQIKTGQKYWLNNGNPTSLTASWSSLPIHSPKITTIPKKLPIFIPFPIILRQSMLNQSKPHLQTSFPPIFLPISTRNAALPLKERIAWLFGLPAVHFLRKFIYILQLILLRNSHLLNFMFTNQQWHNNSFCFLTPGQTTTAYHHEDSYVSFLLQNQETLASQVQDLKASFAELQKELAEITQRLHQQDTERAEPKRVKGKNGTKGKKIFAKDLKCPFLGCTKNYSSKIALNAHLRKVHRGSSEGDHLQA